MKDIYAVSIDVHGDRLLLSNGDMVEVFDYLDEDMNAADVSEADTVIYLDGIGNMRAVPLNSLPNLVIH